MVIRNKSILLLNDRTKNLVPFVILYIIRMICYISLIYNTSFVMNFVSQKVNNVEKYEFLEFCVDLIFLFQLNLFNFYSKVLAILENDIYKFKLSIFLLVHFLMVNLSTFYIAEDSPDIEKDNTTLNKYFYVVIVTTILFDVFLSIKLNARKISEKTFELFKKIGPDRKINEAYANRKFLEVFSSVNVFLILSIVFIEILVERSNYDKITALEIVLLILTLIQQLFISVNFYDENILQRKIAIFFTIAKIPLTIYIFILCILDIKITGPKMFFNVIISYINVFILDISIIIALILDYKKFGSGLKEHLKKRNFKLDLSE